MAGLRWIRAGRKEEHEKWTSTHIGGSTSMPLTEEGIIAVPGLHSRWVRLASGAKAHYVTSGEDGPAVVLLHGGIIGSSSTAAWRYMAPFLGANGFRVFCPDQPGFGLTEGYEDAYLPNDAGHVDFLHEFTTALCLSRFHLAGNSMGSANTVNYVTAHPDRVISFALIAGPIGDLVPRETVAAHDYRPRGAKPNPWQFDGTADSMRRMMEAIILDPSQITDDLVEMRTRSANRHRAYYEATHRARQGFGPQDPDGQARMSTKGRFDRIVIPGIYMYGAEDLLMPHDVLGHLQEDALPQVQFFYPEKTGHQGQTDQPELFNQVFLEFFRDGKVAWETARVAGISGRRDPNPRFVSIP